MPYIACTWLVNTMVFVAIDFLAKIHQYLNEKATRKSRSKILMHMIHMQMQNNYMANIKYL